MSNSGRGRSRNRVRDREDRFYSPPPMRRQHQQQDKSEQSEFFVNNSSSSSRTVVMTNLDRFMKHTTPIVSAQQFPKTSIKGWRQQEPYQPYFVLGDLWESFREWSAYGAGVPLVLNERDHVVQYYSPFLSGIQLYVDPSAPKTTVRRPGEGSESDSSRGTSSDGSYEAGHVVENNVDSIAKGLKKVMLNEGEIRNPPGLLVYEYFERELPFHRPPLADQALKLASTHPVLRTYRSCDLTPSSWFSIAWYPIYRIPLGPSLQDVDSCFLTFHSLSTPLRGMDGDGSSVGGSTVDDGRLSLPIFGFAVYKFNSSDWIKDAVHGIEKVNSMIHSTDNWLRRLGVNHPDFMFFKNRHIFR